MDKFSFHLFVDVPAENIKRAIAKLRSKAKRGCLSIHDILDAANVNTGEEWSEDQLLALSEED